MAKPFKYVQQDFLEWLSTALAAFDSVATRCAAALVQPRAMKPPPRARHRRAHHRKPAPLHKRLTASPILLTPAVLTLISAAAWAVLAR